MTKSTRSVACTRRRLLTGTVAGLAWGASTSKAARTIDEPAGLENAEGDGSIRLCLNTSTIRGQGLGIVEEVELAAEAGYDGIEPWIREIEQYRDQGGSLSDLRKRIADAGLTVEGGIGFAEWIVDDPDRRRAGLERARRDMDLLRQIGGTRIAAPPAGATDRADLDLAQVAMRYRDLLKVGRQIGVQPMLEVWGFAKILNRLGQVMRVAVDSGHPDACLLPDVYHLYKGGNAFESLGLIHGRAIPLFHVNDYPADPPRDTIGDADRVYPGEGIAPLSKIVNTLRANGFVGAFSLELFNRDYWRQEAGVVARCGLKSMRAMIEKADAEQPAVRG